MGNLDELYRIAALDNGEAAERDAEARSRGTPTPFGTRPGSTSSQSKARGVPALGPLRADTTARPSGATAQDYSTLGGG